MNISKGALKQLRLLQQKKGRDAQGAYLAEGFTIVTEALNAQQKILGIYISGSRAQESSALTIMRAAGMRKVPVEVIKDREYEQISTLTTPPGCLAVIAQHTPSSLRFDEPVLLLDGLQDPGNVGTIIRTADWYGVRQVLLSERCVDIYNPKVVQSAMGSLFRVQCHEDMNLVEAIEELRHHKYESIALALGGRIQKPKFSHRTALIVGNESQGITPEVLRVADMTYTLPGAGGVESLNAAMATGIALSQMYDSIG